MARTPIHPGEILSDELAELKKSINKTVSKGAAGKASADKTDA